MKLLLMSDIHDDFPRFDPLRVPMPDADLCIIAGDITNRGKRGIWEYSRARRWMDALLARYDVYWIPGNHDLDMGEDAFAGVGLDSPSALVYGLDRLVQWGNNDNGLLLWGVSLSPCYNAPDLATEWAHMTTRQEVEDAAYALIPDGVDVIVSHCPPFGFLDAAGKVRQPDGVWEDAHIGSVALRNAIERVKPKVVVCGHVHEARGHVQCPHQGTGGYTDVYNVARSWRVVEVGE